MGTKEFTIPFSGLKLGNHRFEYKVDNTFFEHFDFDEFNEVDAKVQIALEKKPTLLELELTVSGSVNVNCDLTNEPFDQAIDHYMILVVKFGEEYFDDFEEILILPHGSHELDVSQYIYELIILAVPSKRIHPGVVDGTLKSEMLKKLEELSPKETDKNNEEIDPRWNTLKKLLTDK